LFVAAMMRASLFQYVVATEPGKFSVLKHAQDLALQRQWHVADFVEEEGTPGALLEASNALARGAGESAFFVTEQARSPAIARDRGAVDGNKCLTAARAVVMDRASHQFLAGAAFRP
jgi:hypothetical protein